MQNTENKDTAAKAAPSGAKKTKEKKQKSLLSQSIKKSKKQRAKQMRRIMFTALVLALVAGTVLLLLPQGSNDISIAENALGSLLTPVQNAITTVTDEIGGFFTNWRNYDKLAAQYDELYREHEQLRIEHESMLEIELENQRLSALLESEPTYSSLNPLYAKVIARDSGEWFETFTINVGSNDGVLNGMAVACGDGLVGKVYSVGLNYSKVISVIDARSSVAVLVQRTRDNGIMRGQITASSTNSDCYLYRLPNVNNIMPGDKVITSGTDSQYVKGLTVGTITSVSMDESLNGTYAVVSPAVDFRHIEEVFVLLKQVEQASDTLQALPTPTPKPKTSVAPGSTALPTPTPNPDHFVYPNANNAGNKHNLIEDLPEDNWVEDT